MENKEILDAIIEGTLLTVGSIGIIKSVYSFHKEAKSIRQLY